MPKPPPSVRETERATAPIEAVLPKLLEERGLSMRALAGKVGVRQSHISRGLRHADGRKISGELAGRIAQQLGLPDDYFRETREQRLIERLHGDPKLADRLYDEFAAQPRQQ